MTNAHTPLTWVCKFLMRCFMDVIKLTHAAPFSPSTSAFTPNAEKNAPTATHQKNDVPASSATKSTVTKMDLNGYEFAFTIYESDGRIVVSKEAFKPVVTDTKYGRKLVPSNGVEWIDVATFQGLTLEEAVRTFIVNGMQPVAKAPVEKSKGIENMPPQTSTPPRQSHKLEPALPIPLAPLPSTHSSAPVTGQLRDIGEWEFPDMKKQGKKYSSFAIVVAGPAGVKTLQGEGLRDALALAGAQIGQRINVQRLGQEEVQLMDKSTGNPLLDKDGKPKFGKKWQWKITVLK